MDKYQLLDKRGQGSYAVVWKARSRNNTIVAIKQFRQAPANWSEVKTLVEVKIPQALGGSHRNIVALKEVILEHGEFYLVYEYCESSVYETINHLHSLREGVNKTTIRWLMREILEGIAHIHRSGFMHRDIKPENMLLSSKNVKICDFGTAKAVKSKGYFTSYVGTRWYRAPECLLEATKYTEAVDMWAVGVIMAEFYLRRPIFPGTSDIDQLFRICTVMGSPTFESWREGHDLARRKNYKFPPTTPIGIASLIPNASHNAILLMESLLNFNPAKRPSARAALSSHFFKEGPATPLVPYAEKAKGRTRLEALKRQEKISLVREGKVDPHEVTAQPLTDYGNGYGSRSDKDTFHSKGRGDIKVSHQKPPVDYGNTDRTRSAARPPAQSGHTKPNVYQKKDRNTNTFSAGGWSSSTAKNDFMHFKSHDWDDSDDFANDDIPAAHAETKNRNLERMLATTATSVPKSSSRRILRPTSMLSLSDRSQIDAQNNRSKSFNSETTLATPAIPAVPAKLLKTKDATPQEKTKASKKKNKKHYSRKHGNKSSIDRGKSPTFDSSDGEFGKNTQKEHRSRRTAPKFEDDFWTSEVNAAKKAHTNDSEFMDEVLSSWDKNASRGNIPIADAGASLGSLAGSKDKTMYSLNSSTDNFSSPDVDFDVSREGSFWSDKASSPVIIGASHSLQSKHEPRRSCFGAAPDHGFRSKGLLDVLNGSWDDATDF